MDKGNLDSTTKTLQDSQGIKKKNTLCESEEQSRLKQKVCVIYEASRVLECHLSAQKRLVS